MHKLVRSTSEAYSLNDGKAGLVKFLFHDDKLDRPVSSSFVTAWQTALKVHETVAEARMAYAKNLYEMSNELSEIISKTEQTRKAVRAMTTCSIYPRLISLPRRKNSLLVTNAHYRTQKPLWRKARIA